MCVCLCVCVHLFSPSAMSVIGQDIFVGYCWIEFIVFILLDKLSFQIWRTQSVQLFVHFQEKKRLFYAFPKGTYRRLIQLLHPGFEIDSISNDNIHSTKLTYTHHKLSRAKHLSGLIKKKKNNDEYVEKRK